MISTGCFRFSSLLFFVLFIAATTEQSEHSNAVTPRVQIHHWEGQCEYMLIVKTGLVKDAGTDSRISVTLANTDGLSIKIPDLAAKGLMKFGHDYFENGNLDGFVLNGTCVPWVCRITVTSDGTGKKPGWYLLDVEVITTDRNKHKHFNTFDVKQWLAIDSAPYQLSTSRNNC